MSNHTSDTPAAAATPQVANSAVSELAQAIAAAVREGQGTKKVLIAQLKRRSVFNPKGRSRKERQLNQVWRQNGARLLPTRLHEGEISLLNQIGSYAPFEVHAVEGLVDCIAKDKGTGVVEIGLFYNNKREHAIELVRQVRNFRGMLELILAAVKEDDAETPVTPRRAARRAERA